MKRSLMPIIFAVLIVAKPSISMDAPAQSHRNNPVPVLTILLPFLTGPLGIYIIQTFNAASTVHDLRNDVTIMRILNQIPGSTLQSNHCCFICCDEEGKIKLDLRTHPKSPELLRLMECIIHCESNSEGGALKIIVQNHHATELYSFLAFVFSRQQEYEREFLSLTNDSQENAHSSSEIESSSSELDAEKLPDAVKELIGNIRPALLELVSFLPWPMPATEGVSAINCDRDKCIKLLRRILSKNFEDFSKVLSDITLDMAVLLYRNHVNEYLFEVEASLGHAPIPATNSNAPNAGCCECSCTIL